MNWSQYQRDIFSAVANSDDSLIVEAVAGSGKTTTIVEAVRHVPAGKRVVLLAFNKAIADELRTRVPQSVDCMTLHSAGLTAWKEWLAWDAAGCKVDGGKVQGIIREVCKWPERQKNPALGRVVALGKMAGIVPHCDSDDDTTMIGTEGELHKHVHYARESCSSGKGCTPLRGLTPDTDDAWQSLMDHHGIDPEDCDIALARKVLADSIERSRDVIDFDDMLYMPVVAGVPFRKYDVVLLDEAQDVSGIQCEMVGRMVGARTYSVLRENGSIVDSGLTLSDAEDTRDSYTAHLPDTYRIVPEGGRVIAVGDPNQAIYGFRGAMAGSMDHIARTFNARRLPLSVSYRCPHTVVQHAKQWVPRIEAHEDAAAGTVHTAAGVWPLSDYAPGDAVLCRVNRPLVALAFALIRARVPAKVLGRDIGQGIVKLVEKLGKNPAAGVPFKEQFTGRVETYRSRESRRLRNRGDFAALGAMHDRLDTLLVFVEELPDGASQAELIEEVNGIFGDGAVMRGMVTLTTVHKSKGLEFRRVFVLDADVWMPGPWAGQAWEMQQEENLMYVAATRAREELRYVESGGPVPGWAVARRQFAAEMVGLVGDAIPVPDVEVPE